MAEKLSKMRVEAIESLGAKVNHDYEYVGEGADRHRIELEDKVTSVLLPLTPQEWINIATREGEAYVGGCCGNMSVLQDVIAGVFRDGGLVDAGGLLRIGELARGHDGFDEFDAMTDSEFARLIEAWHRLNAEGLPEGYYSDPWMKIGVVFNAVESALVPKDVPSDEGRMSREEALISTLADQAFHMSWSDLFSPGEDDKPSHDANRVLNKAKLLPLLRELVTEIENSGVTLDGFALVKPDTDEVLSDRAGLCLYFTREQAERVQALWARWADEERERMRKRAEEGREVHEHANFWDARKSVIVRVTVNEKDGLTVHREGDA